MSTSTLSQLSPSSSLCDSSDHGDEDMDKEYRKNLLELLTRPRAKGGYDGHLSYYEFSLLGLSFKWTPERIEDCWYDILRGIPTPEATDMPLVVDVVCRYRPLRRSAGWVHGASADSGPPRKDPSTEAPPLPTAPGSVHAVPPGVQSPHPRPSRSCSCDRPQLTHPHRSLSSHSARGHQPQSRGPTSTERSSAGVGKNFARPTAREDEDVSGHQPYRQHTNASRPKQREHGLPRVRENRDQGRDRDPGAQETRARRSSSLPRKPAPAEPAEVFDRLYTHAKGLQRKRKSWTKPAEATPSFRPTLTPYPASCHADADHSPDPLRHRRLTRSYRAKLTRQPERRYDPLEDTPMSARVVIRAPPGPSSFVPPGYVEAVARLRRAVAESHRVSFEDGLRRGPYPPCFSTGNNDTELAGSFESPILRLPLFPVGKEAKKSVDLCLARRTPRQTRCFHESPSPFRGSPSPSSSARSRTSSSFPAPTGYLARCKIH